MAGLGALIAKGVAAIGGASTISTVASVAGTIASVGGAIKQGKDAKAMYNYQSKVQEQQEDLARASGQRAAASRYREGRLIASRQAALAAASGGGSDESVIDLMGDTAAETDLGARTEMFNAEQQARGYADQAAVSRVNAKNAGINGTFNAIGAGLQGTSSLYNRFATRKPKQSSGTSRYG